MPLIRKLSRAAGHVAFGRVLLVAELSLIAWRHIVRLDSPERRRLAVLLGVAIRQGGRLTLLQRVELKVLLVKLEPRLMVGSAVSRVSPVPLPARLLYGPRRGRRRLVRGGAR